MFMLDSWWAVNAHVHTNRADHQKKMSHVFPVKDALLTVEEYEELITLSYESPSEEDT